MLQPYQRTRKSIKRDQVVNFGSDIFPPMSLTDYSHILLHSLKTSKYFNTVPKTSKYLSTVQKTSKKFSTVPKISGKLLIVQI